MDSPLVAIHYMPTDGHIWAEYIRQKLFEYNVECELNDLTQDFQNQIRSVKVNVFFLTPDFLDYTHWDMIKEVKRQSTILVLTGVDHQDLEEEAIRHNCAQALDYYIYSLNDTEESVRDFLISVIALYEDSNNQSKLRYSKSLPSNYKSQISYKEEECLYDTLGKPRQINGIQDVIYKDKTLYLLLQRSPDKTLEVLVNNNKVSPKRTEYVVYEIPHADFGPQAITVIHDSETIGDCTFEIPKEETAGTSDSPDAENEDSSSNKKQNVVPSVEVKLTKNIETQTDVVTVTDDEGYSRRLTRDSLYVNTHDVSRDSTVSTETVLSDMPRNKLEIIRELLEDETDPLEILCQSLGLDKDVNALDEKMADMIKNVETLRQLSYPGSHIPMQDADNSVWPTLLHFGAQFNLQAFCETLLSNPLMYPACLQQNKNGYTPKEIARLHGHEDLAEFLQQCSDGISDKERDSGISGISSGPPAPHRFTEDGYVRMSGEMYGDDLYVNESDERKLRTSSVSRDRVFSGSYDDIDDDGDDQYVNMNGSANLSTQKSSQASNVPPEVPPKTWKEPKAHTPSPESNDVGQGLVYDGDVDVPVQHHRKDVMSLLGITPDQMASPDKEKKKSPKSKLAFFKRKPRSHSDPTLAPDVLSLVAVKRFTKGRRRGSTDNRSSGTGSTASTYSNSSMKEEEEKNVELRDKKGKKKMKGLLSKAKNRESMRISHAKTDQHLQAPALPPRKKIDFDEKF